MQVDTLLPEQPVNLVINQSVEYYEIDAFASFLCYNTLIWEGRDFSAILNRFCYSKLSQYIELTIPRVLASRWLGFLVVITCHWCTDYCFRSWVHHGILENVEWWTLIVPVKTVAAPKAYSVTVDTGWNYSLFGRQRFIYWNALWSQIIV